VREVNDILNQKREVGYTTTLKIMQIMADKGLAERDTRTRTHIYKAAVSERDTQQQLLNRFLETTFKGSAGKLVMQALGNHEASTEELEKIKALIKKIEDQQARK
jgi:predicted transcriptional regulator